MLVVGFFVLLVFFLARSALDSLRDAGSIRVRSAVTTPARRAGIDEHPHFREVWSSGRGEIKVVRIPLTGMIMLEERGWSHGASGSAGTVLRSIRRATADPKVSGIILEINSGGGGITASDVLRKALQDFRAGREGRVVVTLMGDIAASGAYYVASVSDKILAYPTTITGSIGVLIQTVNVNELAERLGIRDVTIKSGASKDLLNPLAAPDEAQRQMLQEVVDQMHERFVRLVAESRDLPLGEVQEIADGRIFLADTAMEMGLVDQLGYARDAEKTIARLLESEEVKVFRYEPEFSFTELFRRPSLFGLSVRDLLSADEPRLMYRWDP